MKQSNNEVPNGATMLSLQFPDLRALTPGNWPGSHNLDAMTRWRGLKLQTTYRVADDYVCWFAIDLTFQFRFSVLISAGC